MKIDATIQFIGLSAGQRPFGREPLFLVKGISKGPCVNQFRSVVLEVDITRMGLHLPFEVKQKVDRALHDWNNCGTCDDHVGPLLHKE